MPALGFVRLKQALLAHFWIANVLSMGGRGRHVMQSLELIDEFY